MFLGSSCQGVATCGLYLILLSQLWNIFARGDVSSCQQYGCNTCSSSGVCTKTNVALNKLTSSSHLYSSTELNEVSGPPCLAVNGDTSITFRPINTNPNNPACVHTDPSDHQPYWEVDLGQQYIISTITVYGRQEHWGNTLRNAIVTVDGKFCYTFAKDYFRPIITQFTCRSSLTGRKVRIKKVNDNDKPYFAVCQVQVWVCKCGYYDPNCTNTCGNCYGATCDPSSGKCPQGCSAGYQPPYCKQGYQGPYCKVLCAPGSYGLNCSNTCGNCSDGLTCNAVSGECPGGCEPGYQGTQCQEFCRSGRHGADCKEVCGRCTKTSSCDIFDGSCVAGCEPGYQLPLCTEASSQSDDTDRVSASCVGLVAGAVVGSCAVCTLGFVLAIVLMRYRHRHEQDKRPSAACFSAQLKTVHNEGLAGESSFETELSTNFKNTTMSTNVYDSLTASRDMTSTYTTLAVKRAGDVRSSPYVNTT